MFISPSKRFLTRPNVKCFLISSYQHHTAASSKKLKSSYFHHHTDLELVYKTISQSFDETAHQYANEECYVFKSEQKRYTYQSFKKEVDALSASLIDLGFQKNDRLAVWLPNTSENVVASFVASKLGLIKVKNFIFHFQFGHLSLCRSISIRPMSVENWNIALIKFNAKA